MVLFWMFLYMFFWFTNTHIYLNCSFLFKSEIARPKGMLSSPFVDSTIQFPNRLCPFVLPPVVSSYGWGPVAPNDSLHFPDG